jgi:hypothetical protein
MSSLHNNFNYASANQCATGYEGVLCAKCSSTHFMANERCQLCEGAVSQEVVLMLTGIVAVIALVVLGVAIVALSAPILSRAVRVFGVVQILALVGVQGIRSITLDTNSVTLAFTYINTVNFDVELLRPGCGGQHGGASSLRASCALQSARHMRTATSSAHRLSIALPRWQRPLTPPLCTL